MYSLSRLFVAIGIASVAPAQLRRARCLRFPTCAFGMLRPQNCFAVLFPHTVAHPPHPHPPPNLNAHTAWMAFAAVHTVRKAAKVHRAKSSESGGLERGLLMCVGGQIRMFKTVFSAPLFACVNDQRPCAALVGEQRNCSKTTCKTICCVGTPEDMAAESGQVVQPLPSQASFTPSLILLPLLCSAPSAAEPGTSLLLEPMHISIPETMGHGNYHNASCHICAMKR